MGLQIFGTKKCPATRKAERFFRDRDIPYQFVDLAEKTMSRGELESVIASTGGKSEALVDLKGKRAVDRGLAWLDTDLVAELAADPLLLRTPIVRDGKRAAVGDDPRAWAAFLPA
jgi:arsenate reductase-like glutaredoxin family protein